MLNIVISSSSSIFIFILDAWSKFELALLILEPDYTSKFLDAFSISVVSLLKSSLFCWVVPFFTNPSFQVGNLCFCTEFYSIWLCLAVIERSSCSRN